MAMIRMSIKAFWLGLIIILFPVMGLAAVPQWEIVPQESSITFTGTLNNAQTSGKFKSFSGEIHFDPERLNESNVRIVVDTGSVATSYVDIADTLKTTDWFDIKLFPQAIFQANKFTKTSDKTYQAEGTLTIRDKTLPIVVTFTQEEYSENTVRVKGTTKLKRTQFGVGQGEWSSTSEVADEVIINFAVTAMRKTT